MCVKKLVKFSPFGLAFILVETLCKECGKIKRGVLKAVRHLEYSG
jgi:hypothetical protein